MFYTSAWCLNGEARFKENIPLGALGNSVVKFGSKQRIVVLVLEGFRDLSRRYIDECAAQNIDLVDFSEKFRLIVGKYENIDRYYSRYERNCFLRWIAFDEYHKAHGGGQFWHLDSDMAMCVSLDELAERTKGMTFMTLGCPCFLTVSREEWFETYKDELEKMDGDIAGYLASGGVTKEDCRNNDHEKFNTSLFREPLGSDQDFLEYLISAGKIYQERFEDIVDTSFYYVQNPLSFFQMDDYLPDRSSQKVENDKEGHLIYKGRRIPFVHYQSGFYYFSAVSTFFGLPRFWARLLLKYNKGERAWEPSGTAKYLWKVLREMAPERFSRNNMLDTLSIPDRKGELKITALLNKSNDLIRTN